MVKIEDTECLPRTCHNQVLSIEAQLAELRDFAKQNNLFIVREYTESKTVKEPGPRNI